MKRNFAEEERLRGEAVTNRRRAEKAEARVAELERQLAEARDPHCGDLVVVAHWPDFDLADSVAVGILERREIHGGGSPHYWICGNGRGWRYCRRVVPLAVEGGK